MNKYKLLIVPSSNDEELFENAVSYSDALRIINNQDIESAQELSFDTEKERDCFLQGYHSAIGYNGDGLYWTKEEETTEQVDEVEKAFETLKKAGYIMIEYSTREDVRDMAKKLGEELTEEKLDKVVESIENTILAYPMTLDMDLVETVLEELEEDED